MSPRVFVFGILLATTGCVTRVHPPIIVPRGAQGCGSPMDCYDKALLVLAETKDYWSKQQASLAVVPIGTVVAFVGKNIPDGWEFCGGQARNRNEPKYRALFEAIGTSHGGDGNPKFQLPDYRGRFLRGLDGDGDDGKSNIDEDRIKGNLGVGSYQSDQFEDHTHEFNRGTNPSGDDNGTALGPSKNTGTPRGTTNYTVSGKHGKETRPKNVAVRWIIKL